MIKDFFQIKNFKQNIQEFPFSFLSGLLFSIFSILAVEYESSHKVLDEYFFYFAYSFFLASFLFVSLQFLKVSKLTKFLTFFLIVGFAIYLSNLHIIPMKFYLFIFLFIAIFISLFWSYLYKKKFNNLQEWEHIDKIISSFITTILFTFMIYFGIILALFAISKLFDIKIKSNRYFEIFLFSIGVIGTNIFLTLIRKRDFQIHSKTKKIISQILLTFSTIYLIILYIYTLYIIITLQLPKGILAWLIVIFSIIALMTFFYYTPYFNEQNKKYKKWFFIALLSQIALLFLSIFIRIQEYGITINRYMIVLFGLWLLFVTIYFLFFKSFKYYIIFLVLSIFIFISQLGPISAYKISEISQLNRLQILIKQNHPLKDSSFKIRYQISSIISYILKNHGIEPFKKVFPNYVREYKNKKLQQDLDKRWYVFDRFLTKKLGFEYVSRWDYEQNIKAKDRVIFLDQQNPINVKGYDYLYRLHSYKDSPMISDLKNKSMILNLSLKTKILTIKTKQRDININLKNFFDRLKNDISLNNSIDKKEKIEKLTYLFENNFVKLKLRIHYLVIGAKEIKGMDINVLVKIY